ncbi:MAG: hypothetical protein IPM52_01375 [Bacteroidetes bacterium]|nr:hypothetical protein [Bacteroidota bacterium]
MFNKDKIEIIKSKGNSGAVSSYKDNLLIPHNIIWPPIEIVGRLYKSNHLDDFDNSVQSELIKELGYYTDLQSINSEDALTWSLFGYISKQNNEVRTDFLNELLKYLKYKDSQKNCNINLWTRLPHPDTFVSGGPEIDVFIQSEEYIILIECKYKSQIGQNQGKDKDKDQIQIRKEWANKIGSKIFPNHVIITLLVGLDVVDDSIAFINWENLIAFKSIPHKKELKDYYNWKKSL